MNFTSNDNKHHRLKGRLTKFLTQKIKIRNKTPIMNNLSLMTQITLTSSSSKPNLAANMAEDGAAGNVPYKKPNMLQEFVSLELLPT